MLKLRAAAMVSLVVVAVAVVAACPRTTTVEATLTVEGMHCEGCSSAITEALEKFDGVLEASADHEAGSARARFRSPGVAPEQLQEEIEGLGYTVTGIKTTTVDG